MFHANMKEVLLYFTNSPVYPTQYVVGALALSVFNFVVFVTCFPCFLVCFLSSVCFLDGLIVLEHDLNFIQKILFIKEKFASFL